MTNATYLGKNLQELRKKSNFSQEELAERLGVSRQAISKWECGESFPDTENLISIAKLYGVSLDELVNNVKETNSSVTNVPPDEASALDIVEETKHINKSIRILKLIPYPILIVIAFLLWGFLGSAWHVSWTLFLTIPVYYSIIKCIKEKSCKYYAYPFFATFLYLLLGMQWGLWHPYWILFITIPVYYTIIEAIEEFK